MDTSPELHLAKLESVIELAQLLGHQSDFDEMLRVVVEKASLLVRADPPLMMINPKTRDTVKTVYAERSTADAEHHFVHTSLAGWVGEFNRKNIFQGMPTERFMTLPIRTSIAGLLVILRLPVGCTGTNEPPDVTEWTPPQHNWTTAKIASYSQYTSNFDGETGGDIVHDTLKVLARDPGREPGTASYIAIFVKNFRSRDTRILGGGSQ